jgi:hypothetical protein
VSKDMMTYPHTPRQFPADLRRIKAIPGRYHHLSALPVSCHAARLRLSCTGLLEGHQPRNRQDSELEQSPSGGLIGGMRGHRLLRRFSPMQTRHTPASHDRTFGQWRNGRPCHFPEQRTDTFPMALQHPEPAPSGPRETLRQALSKEERLSGHADAPSEQLRRQTMLSACSCSHASRVARSAHLGSRKVHPRALPKPRTMQHYL